jgi:hypothetical protein
MAEQQAKPFSPDKTLLGLRTTPTGSIVITNMSDEWALLVTRGEGTPVLLRARGCPHFSSAADLDKPAGW